MDNSIYSAVIRKKTLLIVMIIIIVGWFVYMEMQKIHVGVEQINTNPAMISGKTFTSSKKIDGLHLKNVTLHGTTFRDITLMHPIFENVIFDDCDFINADIYEAKMKDVLFSKGHIISKGDVVEQAGRGLLPDFNATVDNVIFDGTEFNWASLVFSGGMIKLLNINKFSKSNISADNIYLHLESCYIDGHGKYGSSINAGHNSLVTAKKCTFTNSVLLAGDKSVIYAEGCKFPDNNDIGVPQVLVLKNCDLSAAVRTKGQAYLVNDRYVGLVALWSNSESGSPGKGVFYLLNENFEKAKLNLIDGTFFVQNMEIENGVLHPGQYDNIFRVDLQNVTISGNSNWKNLLLQSGGQWENVKIYPSVNVTNAKLGEIHTYNLTYPKGNPWVGSGSYAKMVPSDKPFDWPEIHVPTEEELGLTREWPPITGAPPASSSATSEKE